MHFKPEGKLKKRSRKTAGNAGSKGGVDKDLAEEGRVEHKRHEAIAAKDRAAARDHRSEKAVKAAAREVAGTPALLKIVPIGPLV